MDLATLTALYPVVRDLLNRAPQIKKWIESKAKKEDPIFFMQLQLLESMNELRGGITDLKSSVGDLRSGTTDLKSSVNDLRGYVLTTAIMSAMLSNPNLAEGQIKEKFIKSVEVAGDILKTIKQITP